MHTAPAVSVPVEAERGWRLALAALSLLSPLTAAAWSLHRTLNDPSPWAVASIGAASALFVLTAWAARQSWRLRSPDCLSIHWNGTEWTRIDRGGNAATGDVCVVIDLGHWMLLRFDPHLRARTVFRSGTWLPMSERLQPRHWHALRCAVHGAGQPGERSHEP